MKIKSYTIITDEERELLISEVPTKDAILIKIIGPSNQVKLTPAEWQELNRMEYDLVCNSITDPLEQIPELEPEPNPEPDYLEKEVKNG